MTEAKKKERTRGSQSIVFKKRACKRKLDFDFVTPTPPDHSPLDTPHRYNTRARRGWDTPVHDVENPSGSKRRKRKHLSYSPFEYDSEEIIKMSNQDMWMVRFLQRQLSEGTYHFSSRSKHMHGQAFTLEDLCDFATYGRFCSGDLVKISAMCLFEAARENAAGIKQLLVIDDNDMELLRKYARDNINLARKVWKHVNQQDTVLAVIISRPHGVHWVGGYVYKIQQGTFEIHPRDSNPACGANEQECCGCIQDLLVQCADVCSAKVKLSFAVQQRPQWTGEQPSGSNSCGHYQASSCLLAAMGLLTTYKLKPSFVERCRRFTLLQILKEQSILPKPYSPSQLVSDAPVTSLATRDIFIKMIDECRKDVDMRPAFGKINKLKPGTTIRFVNKGLSCTRVLVGIERFGTFWQGLVRAGIQRCLPGFTGKIRDAVAYYVGLHKGYQMLQKRHGVALLYLAKPELFQDRNASIAVDLSTVPDTGPVPDTVPATVPTTSVATTTPIDVTTVEFDQWDVSFVEEIVTRCCDVENEVNKKKLGLSRVDREHADKIIYGKGRKPYYVVAHKFNVSIYQRDIEVCCHLPVYA